MEKLKNKPTNNRDMNFYKNLDVRIENFNKNINTLEQNAADLMLEYAEQITIQEQYPISGTAIIPKKKPVMPEILKDRPGVIKYMIRNLLQKNGSLPIEKIAHLCRLPPKLILKSVRELKRSKKIRSVKASSLLEGEEFALYDLS